MRRYELMLVFRPDAPDDRTAAIIDRTTRQITAAGGQIIKVAPWGRRRLAYPIERHTEGYYVVSHLRLAPEQSEDVESQLKISDDVIRHMLIRMDE